MTSPSKYTAEYERGKYMRCFERRPEYGCTGSRFQKEVSSVVGSDRVLDVGAGSGALAQFLRDHGAEVGVMDIAPNAGCMRLKGMRKFVHCAWEFPYPLGDWKPSYLTCTDCMEHIPPEHVDAMLAGHRAMQPVAVFYNICFVEDSSGPKLIGEPLHLTIQPFEWWDTKLRALWGRVEQIGRRTQGSSSWWCYL